MPSVKFQGPSVPTTEGGATVRGVARETAKEAVLTNKVDLEAERIERRRLEDRLAGQQVMNEKRIEGLGKSLEFLETRFMQELTELRKAVESMYKEAAEREDKLASSISTSAQTETNRLIEAIKEVNEKPEVNRPFLGALAFIVLIVLGLGLGTAGWLL